MNTQLITIESQSTTQTPKHRKMFTDREEKKKKELAKKISPLPIVTTNFTNTNSYNM